MLAGVVAIVKASGFAETLTTIALSLAFVVAMLGFVRPLRARMPTVPVWGALALALGCAWTTEEIGIHAIFGAFLAGAVMPRGEGIQQEVKLKLETVTLALLLPVFFVVVGLATRIDMLDRPYLWAATAAVIVAAIAGKWGLTVGLELGVIGETIFTIMVLMALVTTLMATPMLALVSPAHRHRPLVVAAEAA